jgi:hypothetical protein
LLGGDGFRGVAHYVLSAYGPIVLVARTGRDRTEPGLSAEPYTVEYTAVPEGSVTMALMLACPAAG